MERNSDLNQDQEMIFIKNHGDKKLERSENSICS